MTTIAYHHDDQAIAYDGRLTTTNGTILTDNHRKCRRLNGLRIYIAGPEATREQMVDCIAADEHPAEPLTNKAIVVGPDGKARIYGVRESGELWSSPCTTNEAIGSGWAWALAAMDHGKTAYEAVEYAATRDCHTGGAIRSEGISHA